jgi:hypothetical protein
MPGTIREAARVLAPGGHLCVVISHPLADVGHFAGDRPDAAFVIRDDYFASRRVDGTVERDGLTMTFRGWTYALQGLLGRVRAGRTDDRRDARAPAGRRAGQVPPVEQGADVPHAPHHEDMTRREVLPTGEPTPAAGNGLASCSMTGMVASLAGSRA